MKVTVGSTYNLTENRGAATVTERIGQHHVMVRFADGVRRKMGIPSLASPAETPTPAPPPADNRAANERRHAEERIWANLKDRIREENEP